MFLLLPLFLNLYLRGPGPYPNLASSILTETSTLSASPNPTSSAIPSILSYPLCPQSSITNLDTSSTFSFSSSRSVNSLTCSKQASYSPISPLQLSSSVLHFSSKHMTIITVKREMKKPTIKYILSLKRQAIMRF